MAALAQLLSLLMVTAFTVTYTQSQAAPCDSREKRQAYRVIHPSRALMFTSFYRPARQSAAGVSGNAQAGGVYAQGNAVGGGAFFQQQQPRTGPIRVLSGEEHQLGDEPRGVMAENLATPTTVADEEEQEQLDQATTMEPASEESSVPHRGPARKSRPKKAKKVPVAALEDDEYEEEDTEGYPVGLPGKPYPFNNFFPVLFTFPAGAASRRGPAPASTGGMPGLVTAIANSYSTSKGGVASSVATAYGGTPVKKPRRSSVAT